MIGFCRFCDQFQFFFLVSLLFLFCIVLNGCLLEMRKINLGTQFQSMKKMLR